MNRKFEDKLAELAFGDLTPEEADRLERAAEANPDAYRTLSMYKDMRQGLKGLAEIPEDQFSKERLRDAILTQGLKPVAPRPASNRAWLWMPCAALLIGFGYTVVRQNFMRQVVPAQIVLGPAALKGTPLTTGTDPIKVAANTPVDSQGMSLLSRGTELDRHSGRSRSQDDPQQNVMARDFNNSEGGEDFGYDDGTQDAAASGSSAGLQQPAAHSRFDNRGQGGMTAVAPKKPAANTTAASSGQIVLIDENKDAQTGAEDATEVSSASNVLIGG